MRLKITDKFLWDLYNIMYAGSKVTRYLFNHRAMTFFPGIRNPVFEAYRKKQGAKKLADLIYYLKQNNYIRMKNLEGNPAIILTKEGIDKVFRASFIGMNKEKRKDGKWIMLIFDMPAKYKKSRNLMRSILHNLGYKLLQHSVWVTPYNVSEKTEELLQFYNLDKYVKIFLIEKI